MRKRLAIVTIIVMAAIIVSLVGGIALYTPFKFSMQTQTEDCGQVTVHATGTAIGWVVVKTLSPRTHFDIPNLAILVLEDIAGEHNLFIDTISYPPSKFGGRKNDKDKQKQDVHHGGERYRDWPGFSVDRGIAKI
jgi:hypothetical protein